MPSDLIKLLLLVAPSIIYFVLLVIITWRILKNREASTSTTFAKGRSDYTSSLLFYTLAATFVGPAYSLGVVDRAYQDTLLFTIIYVLATLHLLGTGLFLWFTRNQQAYTGYETVGDLMDERYGPIGRLVVGAFTTIQYMVFVAVLAVGGAEVLRVVFGLSPDATIALITLIVAGYTFTGGVPAVLQTDKLQFRFLLFIAIVALFTTFTIVLGDYNYINSEQVFNVRALPPEKLLALAVGFLLGEALQPFYITRVFMAPSAKDAGKAFVGTGIFGILWFIILGTFGVALHGAVTVSPGTQALYLHSLPVVFGDGLLSTVLLGLLVAGFLGVVMSTMDSVLHSGAVSFVDDVLCSPVTLPKVSAEAKLTLMQLATILIALLGALIGSRGGDIVDLLLFAYTFWVPTIVPVLAYAFFWKNGSKKSVWVLLVPLFGGLVGYFLPSAWNYKPSIAAGFLANTSLLIILVQIANARRPSQIAARGEVNR